MKKEVIAGLIATIIMTVGITAVLANPNPPEPAEETKEPFENPPEVENYGYGYTSPPIKYGY